jgi:ubiquinone/menaquinone biosynthesis C-methylase UbiE
MTAVDERQKMLQINIRQKAFYESRFEDTLLGRVFTERAANATTNFWSRLRYEINKFSYSSGINEYIDTLHREWIHDLPDLKGAHVLDLGCSTGNHLSLWIAENCAEYIGIDLSEQATAALDAKLRERGLTHARAYAQDFLANSYPDNYFDLVYACAVLHHFREKTVLLDELYRVLKPGGVVISIDPLMTEPLNFLARALYRPLQTDRDWEWPFTYSTFRLFQKYFQIVDMQGFMGMAKLGLPFLAVPGLSRLGQAIGQRGVEFDKKHTRRFGLPFFLCWETTLRLRKLDQEQKT